MFSYTESFSLIDVENLGSSRTCPDAASLLRFYADRCSSKHASLHQWLWFFPFVSCNQSTHRATSVSFLRGDTDLTHSPTGYLPQLRIEPLSGA